MADQAVAVELPAMTTAAHYDWLAATRTPLQSLRFCGAAPAPANGRDVSAADLPNDAYFGPSYEPKRHPQIELCWVKTPVGFAKHGSTMLLLQPG